MVLYDPVMGRKRTSGEMAIILVTFTSGGSRPSDKGGGRGGGGHSDPEIRGGGPGLKKKIFRPFGPHFSLKKRGSGARGPHP